MRAKFVVLTAMVAALVMLVGLLTAGSVVANPPRTIHVIEQPTNFTFVQVGTLAKCNKTTGCQGDYVVGDDPLVDAATRAEVGTLAFECFRIDTGAGLFHCPGNMITLTGRGQIVFAETVDFNAAAGLRGPITGGSGEFLGATGVVTSGGRDDFVITMTN